MHISHIIRGVGVACLCLLGVGGIASSHAQEEESRLYLMADQMGSLDSETAWQEWVYDPQASTSTLTVQTLTGDLDPAIEIRNAEGVLIASNSDYAPNFGTDAQLTLPPDQQYVVRVLASYGAGDYRITAIPGEMTPQWDDDFSRPNEQWAIANATPQENAIRLQTPLTTTRLFIPDNAPPLSDVYVQASFRWGEVRAESYAGLVVRGRSENNGQITGIRLEVTPAGAWALRLNDAAGVKTALAEGQLESPNETITLGLLAQAGQVAAYADGVVLAQLENTQLESQRGWGVLIYDAQLVLEDFRMASPIQVPPTFPDQLTGWESAQNMEIGAALIAGGLMPPTSQRALVIPQTNYTVTGVEQRNFLLTEESRLFGTVAVGGDVVIQSGTDVGCGLVGRFLSRDEKILGYSDTQLGAGLLWWDGLSLRLNNYSMPPEVDPARNRLLLILNGEYAALYVNGQLTAQALVPLRLGNVGVGFVNFGGDAATCSFENVWIWE